MMLCASLSYLAYTLSSRISCQVILYIKLRLY